METHVASVKTDDGVWLYCSVVHQHFSLLDGVSGGQRLFGADLLSATSMVVSTARDMWRNVKAMLCTRDAAFFKFPRSRGVRVVLEFGTIRR